MGDAQSAQREGKLHAAAEEEGGKVDDAQTERSAQHQVGSYFMQIQIADTTAALQAALTHIIWHFILGNRLLCYNADVRTVQVLFANTHDSFEGAALSPPGAV